MAEKQAKGFFQDIDSIDTFKVTQKKEAEEAKLAKDQKEGLIINIGLDRKKVEKIYLKKTGMTSKLTGNALFDFFINLNDYFIEHSKIKVKDISITFRLFSTLLNAGIPLIKSLNTLALQSEKIPRLQRLLFDLASQVEAGSSLFKAMGKYPDVFTEAQLGAIQAGEASGQLNKTLNNLAEEAEKSAATMGKVKGAMVYPAVIVSAMFIVVVVMMILVVPQISGIYTDADQELPLATKILISLSDFMVAYWWLMFLVIAGVIAGVIAWKRTKSGRYYWDAMILKLPVFGNLVLKSVLAKFASSLSNLLSSGVPIIKSIEIVSVAVGNEVYKKRILLIAEDMKSGIPMAENMSNNKLFPSMLVNMIEVGEQTAQLETVTQKIADFYNEEVDNIVSSLTKIMEPMIMVVVGVTVGGLVAAIMLPILNLTSLVG